MAGENWAYSVEMRNSSRTRLVESFHFKSLRVELQGPAVLGHRANDIVGDAFGNLDFDVECDFGIGSLKTGKVAEDFFVDSTGVAAQTCRVERDRTVETPWLCSLGRWGWIAAVAASFA